MYFEKRVWVTYLLCFLLIGPNSLAQDLFDEQATYAPNYRDADIRQVIAWVAVITKKEFRVDPSVNGRVTIEVSKPVTIDTVYDIFLSTLRACGFEAVPVADVIYIVPVGKAPGLCQ